VLNLPPLPQPAVHIPLPVKGWITAQGGEVIKVDPWGKRRMAYAIRKRREGYYVLIETNMPPQAVAELERHMRLHEPIMRYLVTRIDE